MKNSMSIWRASAAVAALGLALSSASAEERTKLRIATEGAYPPFNNMAADGRLVGFDIEIADALCARMKAECEYLMQDWDGLIPALQAGKFDAIVASMTITEERKQQVSFTDKYYATPLTLVARKDSQIGSTKSSDLTGKTVGAQAASVLGAYAEEFYGTSGAVVKLYPTQDDAVAELSNGRLDAVLGDRFAFLPWMKSAGKDCCEVIGDIEGIEMQAGIAVRKDDKALLEKLNTALAAVIADGTYDGIVGRYFDFDIYGN